MDRKIGTPLTSARSQGKPAPPRTVAEFEGEIEALPPQRRENREIARQAEDAPAAPAGSAEV